MAKNSRFISGLHFPEVLNCSLIRIYLFIYSIFLEWIVLLCSFIYFILLFVDLYVHWFNYYLYFKSLWMLDSFLRGCGTWGRGCSGCQAAVLDDTCHRKACVNPNTCNASRLLWEPFTAIDKRFLFYVLNCISGSNSDNLFSCHRGTRSFVCFIFTQKIICSLFKGHGNRPITPITLLSASFTKTKRRSAQ